MINVGLAQARPNYNHIIFKTVQLGITKEAFLGKL